MQLPALELICPACSLQGHLIRGRTGGKGGDKQGGQGRALSSSLFPDALRALWMGIEAGKWGALPRGWSLQQGLVSGFHLYCGGSDVIIT